VSAFALLTTTVGKLDDARTIARSLVTDRFAACVQILQADSVYAWNGAIEESAEWLLVCKIRADDFAMVEAAILAIHPYDTPEIVATSITDGFQPYLDWIAASTAR
jgi:periplasmic divalent cation tolerance protein